MRTAPSFARSKAFTLIELLVVISIIALLSAIILVAVQSARTKARIAASIEFEYQVYVALYDYNVAEYGFDSPDNATCTGASTGSIHINDLGGNPAADLITDPTTGVTCSLAWSTSPLSGGTSLIVKPLNNTGTIKYKLNNGGTAIPVNSASTPNRGFTYSFWIRSLTSAIQPHSVDIGDIYVTGAVGQAESFGVKFARVSSGSMGITPLFNDNSTGGSASNNYLIPMGPFNDLQWHHVLISFYADGPAIVAYLDGNLTGACRATTPNGTTDFSPWSSEVNAGSAAQFPNYFDSNDQAVALDHFILYASALPMNVPTTFNGGSCGNFH